MKTVEETRRELFKALAETRGLNLWYRFKGGEYADEITASAWWAFNAVLDSVVIELPDKFSDAPPYSCYEGGWNDMRDEAKDSIESTNLGLKVK